jgi:hypothetical protein
VGAETAVEVARRRSKVGSRKAKESGESERVNEVPGVCGVSRVGEVRESEESERRGMKQQRWVDGASGWICPTCRRRFARAKQWHSCKPQPIDVHFVNRDPALRQLFEFLIRRLKKTGPLRIDAVQTSINLISRHHFGGITVRRGYLRLGFLARKRIHNPRIVHHQILGPIEWDTQ